MNQIDPVVAFDPIKTGLLGAVSAMGGGIYAAAISPDVLPVIGGIGVGIIGIGWSIYAAGRDRRAATLTQQIDLLQKTLDALEIEMETSRTVRRGLRDEIETQSARIAHLTEEINLWKQGNSSSGPRSSPG